MVKISPFRISSLFVEENSSGALVKPSAHQAPRPAAEELALHCSAEDQSMSTMLVVKAHRRTTKADGGDMKEVELYRYC
jgi:hypothetical protein